MAATALGGIPLWAMAFAWILAVALPIQAFAYLSGAHLNPAVTLGLVAANRFPARDGAWFVASQVLGAFVGSLAVWGFLGRGAHLGATVPGPAGPVWVLPLEFGFTFLLVTSILWLTGLGRDPHRTELLLPAGVVGLSTYLIGPWTGSSLNPARTIAPAVLSGDLSWLWLYLVATVLGSLASVLAATMIQGRSRSVRPLSRSNSDPTDPSNTVV